VDRRLLGVATSATQFIRQIGATVGTAVIGSIVTKGYAEGLVANAPPRAPQHLVSALENPQALVSEGARQALVHTASTFPGGQQLVNQMMQTAREALSGSIHDGFVFTLFAVGCAIGAALLMKNVKLEERNAEPSAPTSEAERDRKLLVAGVALEYLSRRIESANGDAPNLIRAASTLVPHEAGSSERALALRANEGVIKPISRALLLHYLRQHKGPVAREGARA
jgi:hypothetical protein